MRKWTIFPLWLSWDDLRRLDAMRDGQTRSQFTAECLWSAFRRFARNQRADDERRIAKASGARG